MPSLNPKQFLYHEAHLNDRESIRSGGLRASKELHFGAGPSAPAGVYMSPSNVTEYGSSMHDASHFGYDRWRVDVTGLPVHADPTQPNSAHYTPESISPDRLRLAKKGHPDWKKHI